MNNGSLAFLRGSMFLGYLFSPGTMGLRGEFGALYPMAGAHLTEPIDIKFKLRITRPG